MGNLLSILTSNKKTKEKLEDIQNEIDKIEDYKLSALVREKNYTAFLIILSVIIYIFGIIYLYFTFKSNNQFIFIAICFVILFPITPYFIKKFIRLYFKWLNDNNNIKLVSLIKLKKKILSKVQETETFNDAKIILEKYDPLALRNLSMSMTDLSHIGKDSPNLHRPLSSMSRVSRSSQQPPNHNNRPKLMLPAPNHNITPNVPHIERNPNISRTVRPILPQERSVVEKMVDYIFSDGPSNRYALICSKCSSHNGMALPNEFEYISYICAYCSFFNPSRKVRPTAPTLELPKAIEAAPTVSKTEDDDENSNRISDLKIIEVSSKLNKTNHHEEQTPIVEENESDKSQDLSDDLPTNTPTKENHKNVDLQEES